MKYKRLKYLICGLLVTIVLILFPFRSYANSMEINLVSGNETGKYYAIARDIEKLAMANNIDIDVIPTQGALQNIHDVFFYDSISLGITQGDVLAFLNTFANDDELFRVQAESLRLVLPLYQEQIHLITRDDIKSIDDLAGKKISIGEEGSGTSITASTLLYQWQIKPEILVTYDPKKSIDALREKEIDAFFYVIGKPSSVLQEGIFPDDNFHLLPVTLNTNSEDEFYSKLYTKTTIPANTYSWQKEGVETLAVQSFLFTVERDDCQSITPVANLIKNNLSWLQKNGDSLWQTVDLTSLNDQKLERLSACVKS